MMVTKVWHRIDGIDEVMGLSMLIFLCDMQYIGQWLEWPKMDTAIMGMYMQASGYYS